MPTQLLPTIAEAPVGDTQQTGKPHDRRRHVVLLSGAAAVAVATFAGYALLRPGDQPETWTSMSVQSLPPAVGPGTTGPTTAARVTPDTTGADDGDGSNGRDPGQATSATQPGRTGATSPATGTALPNASAGSPAGGPSTTAITPATTMAPIYLPPTPVETGSGLLVTGTGLCLDLRGGAAVEGGDVHIDDCNGTSPQLWNLSTNHTLEVLGLCAYLVGDSTVELTACDGRTTAQWQLMSDGVLTNAANGGCLTDPSMGTRPGSAVIVTTCVGGSNQRWTFR